MGPSMSIDGVASATPRTSPPVRRFNGAVDEHRRSHAMLMLGGNRDAPASMGPSMSIDGVRSGKPAPVSLARLQWGRR